MKQVLDYEKDLGGPQKAQPDKRRPPKAPQGQQVGTFKHCITKPSGNHQSVKGK